MTGHTSSATATAFVAGPFRALLDDDGIMRAEHRARYLGVIELLEGFGYHVHNAHQREGWGAQMMAADECTKMDFEQIRTCDLFVAFPGVPGSPGTHVEIGWASACRRRMILLLERDQDYAALVEGLVSMADVELVRYSSDADCLAQIRSVLERSHGTPSGV